MPSSREKYMIFGAQKTPEPRAFGFVVSNDRKDSWDKNASSLRHAALFLGGPRLPPEVVSARLNFLAHGPKDLLLHIKNYTLNANMADHSDGPGLVAWKRG